MKFLVASDIHGSAEGARAIAEKFVKTGADKIIILGDILYHGPRNAIPETYNPIEVAQVLNEISKNIIAIKGNCDAEVDQMVLNFSLSDSAIIMLNNREVLLTHGQHINPEKPAKIADGAVVLYGHFHKISKNIINNVVYINVGSIAIPKGETVKCYSLLDENGINFYDLNDNLIKNFDFSL